MKILQLCPRVPFPANDGGTIAMFNLAKGLMQSGNEVRILALNTKKHFVVSEPGKILPGGMKMESVEIDTSVNIPFVLGFLFGKSSHMRRFYSSAFNVKLTALLKEEQFDIIQLEGLPMCNYIDTIRKNSKAKISYRAHNVEHVVWDRITYTETSLIRKGIYGKLAQRLKKYEYSILNKADSLIPISTEDEKKFINAGSRIPIHTSVVGVETALYSTVQKVEEFPSVFHFGSMDWLPNEEAVKWFLKEIWPKIKIRFPDLCFYIAGRNLPGWLNGISDKNVKPIEHIPDAKEFIRSRSILVVPLRSGSGMKVKIIEGLASGKAIVTTTIGAEGIEAVNKKNILIADTAEEFAEAVTKLVQDKEFFASICREARLLAEKKFDSFRIAVELSAFYKNMLDKKL